MSSTYNDDPRNYATASTSNTGGSSKDTYQKAYEAAGDTVDRAQEKIGQVTDSVKEKATDQLSTQKDSLAEGLGSVANMIRMAGNQMRDQNQGMIAGYANKAADTVDDASRFLRDRDLSEIVDDVQDFARREPALFLGGAFALGLFAARFLKSSGNGSTNQNRNMNYDQNYYDRSSYRASYGTNYSSNVTPGTRTIDDRGAAMPYPSNEDIGYGESALGNIDVTSTPESIDPQSRGITGNPIPGTEGNRYTGQGS